MRLITMGSQKTAKNDFWLSHNFKVRTVTVGCWYVIDLIRFERVLSYCEAIHPDSYKFGETGTCSGLSQPLFVPPGGRKSGWGKKSGCLGKKKWLRDFKQRNISVEPSSGINYTLGAVNNAFLCPPCHFAVGYSLLVRFVNYPNAQQLFRSLIPTCKSQENWPLGVALPLSSHLSENKLVIWTDDFF